jgi:hypothetical protein
VPVRTELAGSPLDDPSAPAAAGTHRSPISPILRPMPPVPAAEYASATVRQVIIRDRNERRNRFRSHWWYPLFVLLIAVSGLWGLIKADQLIAQDLIWPGAGAQFVEVGPPPDDPEATGGRMMVVVAGLNRKSGTGVAAALMPSLTAGQRRVFSLVYGSGISDQDIIDKFNGLLNRYQPREVSFFGSSMGGDVVLGLAAHLQNLREGYRLDLQSAAASAPVTADPEAALQGHSADRAAADRRLPSSAGPQSAGPRPTQPQPTDPQPTDSPPIDDPAVAALSPATSDDDPLAGLRKPVGAQAARIAAILVLPDSAVGLGVGATATGWASGSPSAAAPPAAFGTAPDTVAPPRLGTIYLDCSPLGAADVRDASRTQADLLTGVIEALDTEGGAVVRLTAEVVAQREQWSSGAFPFLQVRYADLKYKVAQVMREKISGPGISTQLIKDQYGVIRRTDIDEITDALGPGARLVYFLPENRLDDHTVRVEQVEATLLRLAVDKNLDLRIVQIPDGHHASAESNSEAYRRALDQINGTGT